MSEETLFDEWGNFVEAGGAIVLTADMDAGAAAGTALLTVRGKDHDLTAAQLRRIAAACEQAAAMLEGGA